LNAAQSQLDTIAKRPALDILLPLGQARLANAKYKIHTARATCVDNQTDRYGELRQALIAAQHAAELYSSALDYQSTAIMQFNVAVADHDLGDMDAAVSDLEAAIATDRSYGFRKDAEDNYKLLLHWKNEDESDESVAVLMKDFPERSAEFKFNWSNTDTNIAIDTDDTSVVEDKIIHSRGEIALKGHIRAASDSWTVSYEPGDATYDLGDWPINNARMKQVTMYLLANALLQTPQIQVSKTGDFKSLTDARNFRTTLIAGITAQLGKNVPGSDK
jgi:tetratricopeptide (TPR) repeat protein